jgi:phage shock protein A
MFRISKAAMDTSLERIRAKIAELEAKIADLRPQIAAYL